MSPSPAPAARSPLARLLPALLPLALLLPALAPGVAAATSLGDPRDAEVPAADLRRVSWVVGPEELQVGLETHARPDTFEWDYVGVLVLGNATERAPREAYYFAKTLASGSIVVARHLDNASATPRLSVEGERLRFAFPRVVPANGTAEDCAFAVAGTGQFRGNGTGALDTAPDGGDVGEGDPWRLRTELCRPPQAARPSPGGEPALLLLAAPGAAALAARLRRKDL